MTPAFTRAFDIVVGHEGGYTTGKNDPGGETKFGISKRAFPKLDIFSLQLEDARRIYLSHYWTPIQGDKLPAALGLLMFDAAINNGVAQATRWLQRAAGVRVDGALGPATLLAARAPGVDAKFHLERALMMTQLPTWDAFGKGWCIRLATLPFQALALDD